MDLFLSQAHTGSELLGSYKTQTASVSCQSRKKLGVGRPTKADFSRTVSGVASSLYLVNPGAPSDRERLILAASLPDSFVFNYRDAVISAEAPAWCLFNSPALHEHVFRRLERSGLANRSKFVTNPIMGAGELCGFRYHGGSTPQNLVFPIGASEINWLVAVRGATRFGMVAASAKDAADQIPDLVAGRNNKQALRRLRIWRALNWVSEASRASGLIRYEPFSVGCALYDHEATKMQLKGKYERSMLYLGDHFSKESVLFADIARGGLASDFWTVAEAVIRYKNKHSAVLESDGLENRGMIKDAAVPADWTDILARTRAVNEHGDRDVIVKTLDAAVKDFSGIGENRRAHLLDFISTCLTPEQRESIFKGLGGKVVHSSALTNLADSVLANTAKSGVWVMMHSLLKQVTFSVLHLVGYEAQRKLIFKLFLPALIALFIAQDGIGDSFVHGVFNLEFLKQRVAGMQVRDMLSRDPTSSMVKDASSSSTPARNFAQFDIATLYGRLSDCASIPLALNVGVPLHKAVMQMNMLDHVVKYTVNTGLAKQRIAEENRVARRLQHRRRLQETAAIEREKQRSAGIAENNEDMVDEEEDEVEEGEREKSGEGDEDEGKTAPVSSPRKHARRSGPTAPIPLTGGRLRENIGGFAIKTIQNEDRQINVESIQKLLTARYTKNRKLRNQLSCGIRYNDNEMAEVSIKYIMNFFDSVFRLRQGSILNSIHCNRRIESGVYAPSRENCNCSGGSEYHEDDCISRMRNRDAICAESKKPVCPVDAADSQQVASRFQELIMDPPSLTAVEDSSAIEQVLQNEQLMTLLLANPVFNAVLGAEKGDLGRYVVLSNIVKFMNVLIVCLVDGDMPLLLETRAGVKEAVEKGKVCTGRKRPYSSTASTPAAVADAQATGFHYINAGHCPESGLRETMLPECILKLKSSAMEKGSGGKSALKRQKCDHTFCKMLKFFFFSIDPAKAVESFTDPHQGLHCLS